MWGTLEDVGGELYGSQYPLGGHSSPLSPLTAPFSFLPSSPLLFPSPDIPHLYTAILSRRHHHSPAVILPLLPQLPLLHLLLPLPLLPLPLLLLRRLRLLPPPSSKLWGQQGRNIKPVY